MAPRAKKPAPRRTRKLPVSSDAETAPAKSKDANKTFGKAAPRRVKPAVSQTSAKNPKRRATDQTSATDQVTKAFGGVVRSIVSLFRKNDTKPKRKS